MNALIEFLPYWAEQFIQPEVLLNLIIKVSLILAVTGLLNTLLYRSSAAVRHWLWSVAFLSVLVFPAAATFLPSWQLPVLPNLASHGKSVVARILEHKEPQQVIHYQDSETHEGFLTKSQNVASSNSAVHSANSKEGLINPSLFAKINWNAFFLLIWLAGVFYILTRLCFEVFAFAWLARKGEVLNGGTWQTSIQELTTRLGIERRVKVVLSTNASIPLTLGMFRPTILLPIAAKSWTPEQSKTVLIHELAHIKRLDYLSNLLTHVACAIYWYNPVIWIAAKKVYLEREHASDDFVLREGTENIEYANQLLQIVRPLTDKSDIGCRMVAMVNHSQIKKRMQHILKQKTNRDAITRFSAVLSSLIVAALILPLAVVHLQAKHESDTNYVKNVSFEDLIHNLKSGVPTLQKQAAWSLGEREDRRAVDALVETLKAENAEVRGMAAWALGEIKDKRSLQPLMTALNDPDVYVREMIARVLGENEDSRTLTPLLGLLSDDSAEVRAAALWALGKLKDKNAFYKVVTMLKDGDVNVRKATLDALFGINCDPAFASVTAALKDPHPGVREKAAKILASFSRKPVNKALPRVVSDYSGSSYSTFLRIMPALENKSAVDYLIEALQDPAPAVRQAAATTLGEIGNPRAVEPLMDKLVDSDSDVRAAAIWALDEINLP